MIEIVGSILVIVVAITLVVAAVYTGMEDTTYDSRG